MPFYYERDWNFFCSGVWINLDSQFHTDRHTHTHRLHANQSTLRQAFLNWTKICLKTSKLMDYHVHLKWLSHKWTKANQQHSLTQTNKTHEHTLYIHSNESNNFNNKYENEQINNVTNYYHSFIIISLNLFKCAYYV